MQFEMNRPSGLKAGSKFCQRFGAAQCGGFEEVPEADEEGRCDGEQAKLYNHAEALHAVDQRGKLETLPEDGAAVENDAGWGNSALKNGRPALYVDLRNIRQRRAPYIPPDSSKSDYMGQIRSVQSYDLPKEKSQLKNLSGCDPEY